MRQRVLEAEYVNIEFLTTVNGSIDQLIRQALTLPKVEKWEYIKKFIKKAMIKFSRQRSSEEQLAISKLLEYITHTEDK